MHAGKVYNWSKAIILKLMMKMANQCVNTYVLSFEYINMALASDLTSLLTLCLLYNISEKRHDHDHVYS